MTLRYFVIILFFIFSCKPIEPVNFIEVKDVKPLSFKRGFVKSYSHNPSGVKVMYDRKYFTSDHQKAMATFMKTYEKRSGT